tara:strand:- start:1941 stop:3269 length:1329 start_codon:yes stop_codon:yes gene_type:complete
MSRAGASNYTFFQIKNTKTGVEVPIVGKILNFYYYESLYSSTITGSLALEDVGGSVEDEKTGVLATIKDGMKLTGFEEVSFHVFNESGNLNFRNYPLIVTGSPAIDESNRQVVLLKLVSKTEIDSSSKPLSRNYPEAPISDTIAKILADELQIPKDKLGFDKDSGNYSSIENTKNQDKIKGNHFAPLDVVSKMCNKSIPANYKDPGYFFYETQDGFNFRSIDGLIDEGIKSFDNEDYEKEHTYYYTAALAANLDKQDGNNYKIVRTPVFRKDEDIIKALRTGMFNVRITTRDRRTGVYTEEIKNLLSDTNLGEKQDKSIVDDNVYLKSFHFELSPGQDDPGVSDVILNNPADYVPQANMRYSLLHAQMVDILIPCNLNLRAGEVIKLYLENITQGDKNNQVYNNLRSGYYMICHLCHSFSTTNSYTSLTLLRDTRELYRSSK